MSLMDNTKQQINVNRILGIFASIVVCVQRTHKISFKQYYKNKSSLLLLFLLQTNNINNSRVEHVNV